MNQKLVLLSLFLLLVISNACLLTPDECNGVKAPQLLSFDNYTVIIDSPKDTLSVGDSIRCRITMSEMLVDANSMTDTEVESIKVSFAMTRDTDEENEESLIEVFDQYFEISMTKGSRSDAYHFTLEKVDNEFQLDFHYICKKPLKYYIPIAFDEIIAKQDIDIDCMLGDTDAWSASVSIDSEFNNYYDQETYPNYFGFIVQ